MEISYTSQAKEDLARIDWRIREDIIKFLGDIPNTGNRNKYFKPLQNSDLVKIDINEHVIVGKLKKKELVIVSVLKRKKIKLPE
jgi:mRNA-degrading endonuclease RelE of RelBE toxin-antitoxin system